MPAKTTMAPALGERTREVVASMERGDGARETWTPGAEREVGSEGGSDEGRGSEVSAMLYARVRACKRRIQTKKLIGLLCYW